MIVHDAKELAGCFYEEERSDVFRATWPKQQEYIDVKWPHFVAGVREAYSELLGRADESVPEDQKERMYEALIADAPRSRSEGAPSPIPILRGTEAFHGSRAENRRILEAIGKGSRSLAAKLRSTTALFPQ